MAQLYYQDSGMMVHQGYSVFFYQTDSFWAWDPAVHATTDYAQVFLPGWEDKIWFLVPGNSEYYARENDLHPLLAAASTLFTAPRWEQIEDYIDEYADINNLLALANYDKARHKFWILQDKALITAPEYASLISVLAHLP